MSETKLNKLTNLIRSKGNVNVRNAGLESVQKEYPRIIDSLSTVSQDLQRTEELLDIITNPDTSDLTVEFFDRLANDPHYQFDLWEPFINQGAEVGEIGTHGWTFSGGGAVVNLNAEKRHPGIIRVPTTNVSGNITALFLGGAGGDLIINSDDPGRIQFLIRLGSTITAMKCRLGLMANTATSNVNGIYWEYTSSDGLWHPVTQNAGTETRSDARAAVASQWEKLEIIFLDDECIIDFYTSDTLVASHTTNIPTNIGHNIGMAVEVSSNNIRQADIDEFRMTGKLLPYNERFV